MNEIKSSFLAFVLLYFLFDWIWVLVVFGHWGSLPFFDLNTILSLIWLYIWVRLNYFNLIWNFFLCSFLKINRLRDGLGVFVLVFRRLDWNGILLNFNNLQFRTFIIVKHHDVVIIFWLNCFLFFLNFLILILFFFLLNFQLFLVFNIDFSDGFVMNQPHNTNLFHGVFVCYNQVNFISRAQLKDRFRHERFSWIVCVEVFSRAVVDWKLLQSRVFFLD